MRLGEGAVKVYVHTFNFFSTSKIDTSLYTYIIYTRTGHQTQVIIVY